MVASCERHQVDLQRYLPSVLAKICATADDELKYFLPDVWKVEYATEHFPKNQSTLDAQPAYRGSPIQ